LVGFPNFPLEGRPKNFFQGGFGPGTLVGIFNWGWEELKVWPLNFGLFKVEPFLIG